MIEMNYCSLILPINYNIYCSKLVVHVTIKYRNLKKILVEIFNRPLYQLRTARKSNVPVPLCPRSAIQPRACRRLCCIYSGLVLGLSVREATLANR